MTARRLVPALALALACSDLTGSGGVVALELRLPSPASLEPGDTLQLRARALDANGDSVAATILWVTPDTTITVTTDGRAATSLTAGTGRVQARTGSLVSPLQTLTIRPHSDTVEVTGPTDVTVDTSAAVSDTLRAAILSFAPAGGVSGAGLIYEVQDSAAVAGLVDLPNGALTLRAATGATGAPITPVTLRRVAGQIQPDSVMVTVRAERPSGAAVPGSGQAFIVRFINP
jgi:hypothetical protein